jgi:hypothetical protein
VLFDRVLFVVQRVPRYELLLKQLLSHTLVRSTAQKEPNTQPIDAFVHTAIERRLRQHAKGSIAYSSYKSTRIVVVCSLNVCAVTRSSQMVNERINKDKRVAEERREVTPTNDERRMLIDNRSCCS